MEKQQIRSIRKGSVQWNEDDRLEIGRYLLKCGYAVRIGRAPLPGQPDKKNAQCEYFVEFWEEKDHDRN